MHAVDGDDFRAMLGAARLFAERRVRIVPIDHRHPSRCAIGARGEAGLAVNACFRFTNKWWTRSSGGGVWTEAAGLPVAMDNSGVAVMGDAIIVAGGVHLNGDEVKGAAIQGTAFEGGSNSNMEVLTSTYTCVGDACDMLPAPSTSTE